MFSAPPSCWGNPRTDLAAAGKMGLEAGHTGVDGFTALQAGDSCGRSPPTTPHKGHPTLNSKVLWGFSGGRSLKSWILGRVSRWVPRLKSLLLTLYLSM